MFDPSNPLSVYEEMQRLLDEQSLNKEIVRTQARGAKRAGIDMRAATYDVSLLGKHFRDLTTMDENLRKNGPGSDKHAELTNKRDLLVAEFTQSWGKRSEAKAKKSAQN